MPAATVVARALLALERMRATGTLVVVAQNGEAQIAVHEGVPRALALVRGRDDTASVGDDLARSGSLDLAAHRRALALSTPDGPVGAWLVAREIATPGAVSHALREQLRRRLFSVMRWDGVDCRFVAGRNDVGVPHVDEPVAPADLVLSALRDALADESTLSLRRRLGDGLWVLTPLGELLTARAALWPDEAAMIAPLRAGATADTLLAVAHGSPRAGRLLVGLSLLDAIAAPRASGGSYATLLRKTRQLRQAASATTLLDLPATRSTAAEARRSLRRLASALHPDRLGPSAPEALRRASTEVLQALGEAERAVRASAAR